MAEHQCQPNQVRDHQSPCTVLTIDRLTSDGRFSPLIRVQVEARRQVSADGLVLLQDVVQLHVLDGRVEDEGVPRPLLGRTRNLTVAPEKRFKSICRLLLLKLIHNGVGSEAIERLRFLASLALAGTGQREGGEKTQPFNRFQSRLGTFFHDDFFN